MILIVPGGTLTRGTADVDLADLCASAWTGDAHWQDETTLVLPLSPVPTVSEQTLIRRRLMTRDATHEAWVAAIADARGDLDLSRPVDRLLDLLAAEAVRGIDYP